MEYVSHNISQDYTFKSIENQNSYKTEYIVISCIVI